MTGCRSCAFCDNKHKICTYAQCALNGLPVKLDNLDIIPEHCGLDDFDASEHGRFGLYYDKDGDIATFEVLDK